MRKAKARKASKPRPIQTVAEEDLFVVVEMADNIRDEGFSDILTVLACRLGPRFPDKTSDERFALMMRFYGLLRALKSDDRLKPFVRPDEVHINLVRAASVGPCSWQTGFDAARLARLAHGFARSPIVHGAVS